MLTVKSHDNALMTHLLIHSKYFSHETSILFDLSELKRATLIWFL